MLRKKIGEVANGPRLSSTLKEMTTGAVDRRTFLKKSGLAVGGIGAPDLFEDATIAAADFVKFIGKVAFGTTQFVLNLVIPITAAIETLLDNVLTVVEVTNKLKEGDLAGAIEQSAKAS